VNPHRNTLMLRCNNCKHVLPLLFASRSGAGGHRIGGHCAVGAIRRLRSSGGFLDHARAIEALRVPDDHCVEEGYAEGPRVPSDRPSLKVLAYEGSFPPP
jgi:hypothetical protein